MSEAKYFYKNTSIYFNKNIPDEDLEEFAIHECLHFIQEVKDKKNRLKRMGLSEYESSRVYGEGLNEAAVQLITSRIIGIEPDNVKYYGISFETTSPSYYPIECCLVNQLAYLLGENLLFESTLYSDDNFKNTFIEKMSLKAYLCTQSSLDTILKYEEEIVEINNELLKIEDNDEKREELTKKLQQLKLNLLVVFLKAQNQIMSTYFDNEIKKIKTLEQVEEYRRKIYNFKNYIGVSDGYTFYTDYYNKKMDELEHLYSKIENPDIKEENDEEPQELALVVVKKPNIFGVLINKIKSLFNKEYSSDNNFSE